MDLNTSEQDLKNQELRTLVRQLEKEIALSQEKTRLILASLPLGLILVKGGNSIEVVNRVIQVQFAYSRSQLFGKPISLLFPDLKSDSLPAAVETFARRANGDTFPAHLSTVEVPTPNGQRIFVFVSDISERYKMEQMKKDFVAMLSHDLRAPLMSISGILELTGAGKFGELSNLGMELIGEAEKSLTRVIEMISEILEIERSQTDHIILEKSLNNLTVTARSAISDVARLADEKQLKIGFWEDNLFAVFDNDKVHRVLVNLLANAIKFSPEGGSIEMDYSVQPDCHEIRVADRGRGVPEQDRERIFSKYAQVMRSDASEKGGIGLGLAICKAIVEAHGGAIGVRDNSEAGCGSVFWFTIPRQEESSE